MGLTRRWEILLISLWITVSVVPGIHCNSGTVSHLSREDVLLLKDEQDLKCFTRTEEDFTCFFETAEKGAYDFIYRVNSLQRERRCKLSVQGTEEGTFLHICSFPSMDVFSYVDMHLEVVEHDTNTRLYNRTVSVEDHLLLDRPFNVSLHQNGQAGQLQVSWHANIPKYWKEKVMYRIRYSSKGLGEKTKEAKEGEILDSLVPGEEVEVQVTVKSALDPNSGYWSSWSHPVRAVVPQSADDISLTCHTSDLQNISCQWNGSRYSEEKEFKLFYKTSQSEVGNWTEWTECFADRSLIELCNVHGDKSRRVRVKLSSSSSPLSRTFYTPEFSLRESVKTSPPRHVRVAQEKDKFCLKWKAPLPSLSAHLQYEVSYKIRDGEGWMTVSPQGPKTSTCLEVPAGSRYSAKLRAKPNGSSYSGHWSDWSDVLTGDTPADIGTLLLLCIPFLMLMIAIILIFLLTRYLSKLKQYFWPPVPDLDKVLQGFLLEINGSGWNHPITAKQLSEETTSSVVEIMSDSFTSPEKPTEGSTQLLSPERHSSSGEQVDGSPGTQGFPDYVTLNKDSVVVCSKGNSYVYEEDGEGEGPGVRDEPCTDGSDSSSPCLSGDFLNHSYMPLAEPADKISCKVTVTRGPGNVYTNFPCG